MMYYSTIVLVVVLFCVQWKRVSSVVAGVDFGGEYFKVALVKPGTPFEIVTNIHSKRKTETMVAFDNGERFYGADALNIGVRQPHSAFSQIRRFLGQSKDHPIVEALIREEYMPYTLLHNASRGSVGIQHGDEYVFHAEELAAMVFSHAREITESVAQGTVRDWVITVPMYFTQTQRQAILDAAEITGIRVLSLIDENVAAALQYGIDRVYEDPYRVLYYNMGSSSLQVSLIEYSSYVVPDGFKKNKTVGTFKVLGKAWDETLGGSSFDLRLTEHLADAVNKKFELKDDIRTKPRPMAKIRAQARKLKIVLSANEQIPVSMQSLYNDQDFFSQISRSEFESMSEDLFTRSLDPVKRVLEQAELSVSDLDEVEIIGGAVRIPKIQKMLKSFWKPEGGRELGVHLNGDEAMALGAAFRAANLSNAFRVRTVGMEDCSTYAIGARLVDIDNPQSKSSNDDEQWVKRATLFPSKSRLGSRKAVSFDHSRDFTCTFRYDQPSELPQGVNNIISKYTVTGVEDFVKKLKEENKILDNIEPKITCSFLLDQSGMIQLTKVQASVEEEYLEEVKVKKNVKADDPKLENETEKDDPKLENETEKDDQKPEEEKDDPKPENELEKNESVESDEAEVQMVTKTRVHKQVLTITPSDELEEAGLKILPMSLSDKKDSIALLKEMQRRDDLRMENAEAKNELESYVYSARSSLRESQENIVSSEVSSAADVEALAKELDDTEDWLYDEGDKLEAAEYKSRKRAMKNQLDGMLYRLKELTDRPAAVKRVDSYGATTRELVREWESDKPQITEEERKDVLSKLEELEKWVAEKEEEQAKLPLNENPIFSSSQVLSKLKDLKRYVTKLSKRPKPIEPVKEVLDSNNSTAEGNGDASSDPSKAEETKVEDGEKPTSTEPNSGHHEL